MIRLLLGGAGLVALLLGPLWLWPLWRGPAMLSGADGATRDVALAPQAVVPVPLRITVLGTSLSHNELWTASLETALETCLGPSQVTVIARPGAGVQWGLSQITAVAETAPDLVLVEFAINDADLREGRTRAQANAQTQTLFQRLAETLPTVSLVEMTMSPASRLRGVLRPSLAARYDDVITRAQDGPHGAIDLYTRWLALPPGQRGLADGLHPDPQIAETVTVPPVRDYIAAHYSAACAT